MLNWCAPGQAATDYAFLQSLDAILAIAASSVAGLLGNAFGYGWLFAASAVFIAAAISIASRTLGVSTSAQSTSKLTEKVSQS